MMGGKNDVWLADRGPNAAAWFREIASVLERYSDALTESQSTGELDRAKAELDSARNALAQRRDEAVAAAKRLARMEQLAEASSRARLAVTEARFEAIEPLVSDIYRRLDPHPAFKGLGFEHEVHYRRGTSTTVVSDPISGVEADPLIVFSASQANIAALSYFLAMSLGAGSGHCRSRCWTTLSSRWTTSMCSGSPTCAGFFVQDAS